MLGEQMTWWQTILLGGFGGLFSGAVFGSLITYFTNRFSLEEFKVNLAKESTIEIERLRAQLQIQAYTHQQHTSRLCERRAESITEVYSELVEVQNRVANYLRLDNSPEQLESLRRALAESIDKFHRLFNSRRLYFSKGTADRIEHLEFMLSTTAREFMVKVEMAIKHGQHNEGAWTAAIQTMQKEVPIALQAIESEFRQLLGHNDQDV